MRSSNNYNNKSHACDQWIYVFKRGRKVILNQILIAFYTSNDYFIKNLWNGFHNCYPLWYYSQCSVDLKHFKFQDRPTAHNHQWLRKTWNWSKSKSVHLHCSKISFHNNTGLKEKINYRKSTTVLKHFYFRVKP